MNNDLSESKRLQMEMEIAELMKERRYRLNKLMQDNHITLVELEKLTGVAKSSIQRYLTGETAKIPIDFFEKVAKVTNTDVKYLTCFDEKTAPADYRSGWGTKIDSLSQSQRDKLEGYLDSLLAE